MSEKTEKPTPQKLREARRKGQVAKSRMLSGAAVTVAGVFAFLGSVPMGWARLERFCRSLYVDQAMSVEAAALEGLAVLGWLSAPALLAALAASFVANAAQAGLQAQPALLMPKLERVSLAAGVKRLFSMRQVMDTLKNLAISAVVALLVWFAVEGAARDVFRAVWLEGPGSLLATVAQLPPLLVRLSLVMGLLSLGDYALARHRHVKDLMMSRADIKQEHKNSEGDPHAKSKRKSLHRALANAGPARGVHKATAVVVNPTHIAVALRYAPDECEAPYIVATGRDEDALAIRREAKRQQIPVLRDIPLARSLIHYDVGEEVPEELYRAAAVILKTALELQERDAGPGGRTA